VLRRGKLGFGELLDLCRQDEIALCQTVDLVRPGRDSDFSPGKEDVWVMPLLLSMLTFTNPRAQRKSRNLKVFVM